MVAALITGRGGSTLKGKNIIEVCGKPIMGYPAEAAKKSKLIDAWYCSSDDEDILKVGERFGYKRIVRPSELATPTSQHADTLVHALEKMNEDGCRPDIVVVLLANNPCTKTLWIDDCLKKLMNSPELTAVVPAYEDSDHHPLRAKKLRDGALVPFVDSGDKPVSSNRQDLEPCYFLCHNFWCIRASAIMSRDGHPPWSFMGKNVSPYIIGETVDIHDVRDVEAIERWLEANGEVCCD